MSLKTYISLIANVSATQITDKGDKFVIEGVPITVDDAVMNGIRYPAEHNEAGMKSLEDKVVTLSHPMDESGNNADAYAGESLQKFYAGGHVTNTYRVNGIWYADIDINKKRLLAADNGQDFYDRLENKMAIGVSTGLYTVVDNEGGEVNGVAYRGNATDQKYNHLAMLGANEKPAGGDATVMRFNGEDIEHQQVMVSNMVIQHNSTGLDFSGGHRAKMREFEQSLSDALKAKIGEDDAWIEDWNDDTIIYYYDGETYALSYAVGDNVEFSGDPIRVTMKPSYTAINPPAKEEAQQDGNVKSAFKSFMELLGLAGNRKSGDNKGCKDNFTQFNNNEGMSMSHRDIIAKKLGINADQLDQITDDELSAKLDALGGGKSQEPATNAVDVEAIAKLAAETALAAVNAERKNSLVDKLAANAKVGLSAETLGKLDINELQDLADKHSDTLGVNSAFSVQSVQFADLPE